MTDGSSQSKPPSPKPSSGNSSHIHDDNDFWELEDLPETPNETKNKDQSSETSKFEQQEPASEKPISHVPLSEPDSSATSKNRFFTSSSPLEKLLMGVVGIILLLGFGFSARAFHQLLPTAKVESFEPDLPIEGQLITIQSASTYWRRPIQEGTNAHQIKDAIEIIPAVQLKLSPGSDGILRCFFTNDLNEFTGDGITLKISNGTFEKTGNDTVEVYCTDGFAKISGFAYYQTKAHDPNYRWRLVITEGQDLNTRGDDLNQIARLPISPTLFSKNNK